MFGLGLILNPQGEMMVYDEKKSFQVSMYCSLSLSLSKCNATGLFQQQPQIHLSTLPHIVVFIGVILLDLFMTF